MTTRKRTSEEWGQPRVYIFPNYIWFMGTYTRHAMFSPFLARLHYTPGVDVRVHMQNVRANVSLLISVFLYFLLSEWDWLPLNFAYHQGSKFMLANSQNASWNSVLRLENKGTRKKLRVRYFISYQIPILVSKMFQQVYSKGRGKVEAPHNTDCLSCHVTAMVEKIMYFFKRRKEECGGQQVLCQRRGERWTKFQPQETIAIPHRNVKNCSKVGKTNCELDTAICEFKLKPLAKVCEWLKK